jgi:thiamine biosynthesis lipoprotein
VRLTIAFFIAFCCLAAANKPPVRRFQITGQAQGTTYQVLYYSGDSIITKNEVDSIINKIDSSLSLYKPYSLINRFNRSDSGLMVDDHFLTVLYKSLSTFRETNGLFDVTVQPLVEAWGFGINKTSQLPDSGAIRKLKACTGSEYLQVSGNKVVKTKPCIKVDLNGIAQGYTVDLIANFMEKKGLTNYMVELGGEIRIKGRKQPGNEKMKIGIEAPGDDEFQRGIMQRVITIDEGAITTSGNYRRYYETEGKKITHLIDPRTGYPVQNELISITVYAKDAITADAFDNALMAMGLKKAIEFVDSNNGLAAFFIYREKDGSIKDTMSRQFYQLVQH